MTPEHILSPAADLRRRLIRDGKLVLDVKAIPRSRSAQVLEPMTSGALKVRVTAPPERGKANDEVCAVLARYLDVPERNVEIILGHTSRQKRVRIVA
jgi:uncharacterized protein (TIGR00251 family)